MTLHYGFRLVGKPASCSAPTSEVVSAYQRRIWPKRAWELPKGGVSNCILTEHAYARWLPRNCRSHHPRLNQEFTAALMLTRVSALRQIEKSGRPVCDIYYVTWGSRVDELRCPNRNSWYSTHGWTFTAELMGAPNVPISSITRPKSQGSFQLFHHDKHVWICTRVY